MTKRIDHAAEAEKSLADLKSWDTYTHEPIVLKKAHVHATLALVEQQRIANLMTYLALISETPGADDDAQIREALGLS